MTEAWRDRIPWDMEYHFSPPDVHPPRILHHPVTVGQEAGFVVRDRGRVCIALERSYYEFHPLEWSESPPLDPRNPWNGIPFDKRRRGVAAKVRERFQEQVRKAK